MVKHKLNINIILLGIVIGLLLLILLGGYYLNSNIKELDSRMLIKITNTETQEVQEIYLNQAMILIMRGMGILK